MGKPPDKEMGRVGRCIYCGDETGPFTKEHILATGLDGNLVLAEASCTSCQCEINSAVETPFLQGMFQEIRYRRGMGKRRVKDRPKTLRALRPIVPNSLPSGAPSSKSPDWMIIDLPYEKHPSSIALPFLNLPGFLRGVSPEDSGKEMEVGHWFYNEPTNGSKDEIIGIEITFKYDVLFRFLAKTAHCWVVAKYGLSNFEPYLIDIILGKNLENCSHLIGGLPVKLPPEASAFRIESQTFNTSEGDIILVLVRVFSDLGAPAYQIVAGKLK